MFGACDGFLNDRAVTLNRFVEGEAPGDFLAPAQNKKPKRLSYKDQRELDGMETAIAAAEAKTAELEAKLSAPDLYTAGGADVTTLVAQLESARASVERLYARWQELESLVAQL